jgi:hypothetical protein
MRGISGLVSKRLASQELYSVEYVTAAGKNLAAVSEHDVTA